MEKIDLIKFKISRGMDRIRTTLRQVINLGFFFWEIILLAKITWYISNASAGDTVDQDYMI